MDQLIERYQVLDFDDFIAQLSEEARNMEAIEPISFVHRLNLLLATTVRFTWNDSKDIIRAIVAQLLGGMNG